MLLGRLPAQRGSEAADAVVGGARGCALETKRATRLTWPPLKIFELEKV